MAKLKLAIVGTGGMGKGHVAAALASPDFELVAACDINPKALAELPETVYTCSSAAEIFKNRKVDVVSLILPNFLYESHVKMAADHGANVLCEKPFGQNLAAAQNMLKTMNDANLQGFVGGQWKYHGHYLSALPRVKALPVKYASGGYFYYGGNPLADMGWRSDSKKSGGLALIDNGWHSLDYVSHFLGHPTSVRAQIVWHPTLANIDINAQLLLEYPGGVNVDISCDICAPNFDLAFTFNAITESVKLSWSKAEYYKAHELAETVENKDDKQSPMSRMYTELAKALHGEPAYITTFAHAEKIMRVVDGAYRSARENKAITL